MLQDDAHLVIMNESQKDVKINLARSFLYISVEFIFDIFENLIHVFVLALATLFW